MKVLVIDNYDSFVYNLVQYLGACGADPVVMRNDEPVAEMKNSRPRGVVVSPGPGRPEGAGNSVAAVNEFVDECPVLGVCLGHQAIAAAFGGKIVAAPELMHGKTSPIHHDSRGVLSGLADPFEATRYHSLVVDEASLPPELEVTAHSDSGVVMGIRHRSVPVEGVQFHPEAVLTTGGMQLIENFLESL